MELLFGRYIHLLLFFLNWKVNCGVIKDEFRLDIIHFNDFHDSFEETSIANVAVCTTNDTRCVGGFARMYYAINELLKEKPDALVLNAGDVFIGTYWYAFKQWQAPLKFFDLLHIDANAIGNHEFDDGVQGLLPFIEGLDSPFVAANVNLTLVPRLQNAVRSSIILERGGRKIGIIGLIADDTNISSNPGPNITFLDPIATAKREARILTERGIDIIIVLSHVGLQMDIEIAETVGENIDIIVGGHSHSLLWNDDRTPSIERRSGDYPVIAYSKQNPSHKVMIVTASSKTKYLGNVSFYFDIMGDIIKHEGQPIYLNRSIPEDSEIKNMLQSYAIETKLNEHMHTPIGRTTVDLKFNVCTAGECALGILIAEAFLEAVNELNMTTLPLVAFTIKSSLRGSIAKGDITLADIISTLPFRNKLETFKLKGEYLVKALEWCMNNPFSIRPFSAHWAPQIAGMRVVLNATEEKALSVLVSNGTDYAPIVLGQDYQVVTTAFIGSGQGGFTMLPKNKHESVILDEYDYQIVANYIRKHPIITPVLDGRVTVLV